MRPDDSDLDVSDWIAGPYGRYNATCSECGDPFVKGRDEIGTLCDQCCVLRDVARKEQHQRQRRSA